MSMKKITKFVTNKWFLHGLGLFVIALLIWFVGPIVSISENYFLLSVSSRLFTILLLVCVWASYQFFIYYRAKKRNEAFTENLAAFDAKKDEVDAIESRFNEAIDTLKATNGKRSKALLNKLPWYIIIGPPGSGKTTALVNSGVEFPLKDKLGQEAVKGIGGTRHCDWWFTNEAVLIDTAGRFTTQDSDAEVDKAAWTSFVNLLKKHRKQRPINGAIVTMSLSDLILFSEDERAYYAKTIRKRIDELSKNLGIFFPVYFMFTKCDLVSGFDDFFNSLSLKQREQVWGETFELDNTGKSSLDISDYHKHFDELVERLNSQLLIYLKQQNDPNKKVNIMSFPAQMHSMKAPICDFLKLVFGENRYQKSGSLRGVYFTSGTQQGSPFDSLLDSVASEMGVSASDELNFSGRGKSYFIADLLNKVIFPESDIAGVNVTRQRWMRRLQYAGIAIALLMVTGFAAAWFFSYQENLDRIASVEANIDEIDALVAARKNQEAELIGIVNELNHIENASAPFESKSFLDNLGLNQKESINKQTNALYRHALETKLLPLITNRIEDIILESEETGNSDGLYSFLRAYLMYGGQHIPANVAFEPEWLEALAVMDWKTNYTNNSQVIASLSRHISNLLSQPFTFIDVNEAIVVLAQKRLKRLPLETLVYASVKNALLNNPELALYFDEIAGPDGTLVFETKTGVPLEEVFVPGMFTKEGFLNKFLAESSNIGEEYLSNTWVIGPQEPSSQKLSKLDLQEKVNAQYYRDYIAVWTRLLDNLTLRRAANSREGELLLQSLSRSDNALTNLISSVSKQTSLIDLSGATDKVQDLSQAASAVNGKAQRALSQVSRVARVGSKAGAFDMPGAVITDHFKEYHELAEDGKGQSKLVHLSASLSQFASFIQQNINDSFSEAPSFELAISRIQNPSRSKFSVLNASAIGQPQLVTHMLDKIANLGWSLTMQHAKQEIASLWQQRVARAYQALLANTYPFNTNATIEASLTDFSTFFGPAGTYPEFVKHYILPFVDTNAGQWRNKSFGNVSLGLSSEFLSALQRGMMISESFFTKNNPTPIIELSILPISLDASVAQFSLEAGAQQVEYAHGPRRYSNITWPYSSTDNSTTLQFKAIDGSTQQDTQIGQWSLFRLLDQHTIVPTAESGKFRIMFSLGKSSATYEVRTTSAHSPIGTGVLQKFKLVEEL